MFPGHIRLLEKGVGSGGRYTRIGLLPRSQATIRGWAGTSHTLIAGNTTSQTVPVLSTVLLVVLIYTEEACQNISFVVRNVYDNNGNHLCR